MSLQNNTFLHDCKSIKVVATPEDIIYKVLCQNFNEDLS